MIADAWYMVTEYHLRLGPIGSKDNLEEIAKNIFMKTIIFVQLKKRQTDGISSNYRR